RASLMNSFAARVIPPLVIKSLPSAKVPTNRAIALVAAASPFLNSATSKTNFAVVLNTAINLILLPSLPGELPFKRPHLGCMTPSSAFGPPGVHRIGNQCPDDEWGLQAKANGHSDRVAECLLWICVHRDRGLKCFANSRLNSSVGLNRPLLSDGA